MALADIDVTSFSKKSKSALLSELFSVTVYGQLIGKILAENNDTLPEEKSIELLQVALALRVRKKGNDITILRQHFQELRDENVEIFPEISNLRKFDEETYTLAKYEAILIFDAHKMATEELLTNNV